MKHRTKTTRSPSWTRLATTSIRGNLTIAGRTATAWFILSPQRWAWLGDAARMQILEQAASTYLGVVGHRVHTRVTHMPYPVAAWARNLDRLTPNPLPGWESRLVAAQGQLRGQTMAEKVVFVGVEFPRTSPAASDERARTIGLALEGSGCGARPASGREVEWLMHKSVGMGMPAPANLSSDRNSPWDPHDMAAFTDRISLHRGPLDDTTTIRLRGSDVERHVAVLCMGRFVAMTYPESGVEPWMTLVERLGFPVEWCAINDITAADDIAGGIEQAGQRIRAQIDHWRDHGLRPPQDLQRKDEQAASAVAELAEGAPVDTTRAYGWARVAVWGATRKECLDRVRRTQRLYREVMQWDVAHPREQYALLRSFIPGEPAGPTSHRRSFKLGHLAAALPSAESGLGDRRGIYLGPGAGSPVMFDPIFGPRVLEESGMVAVIGSQGSGKTALVGSIAEEMAFRRIPTTILDPSGPLARLTNLPHLQPVSRHIDLTKSAPGTLNPYSVVADARREDHDHDDEVLRLIDEQRLDEAREIGDRNYADAVEYTRAARLGLAEDTIRMLLPPRLGSADVDVVISDALRVVPQETSSTLWDVVAAMETHRLAAGRRVADMLRLAARMPLTRLFFPPEGEPFTPPDYADVILLVITMPGLQIPVAGSDPTSWSQEERASVPALHLASFFATRRVYAGQRLAPKFLVLDEVGQMKEWGSGKALMARLAVDTRKWMAGVVVSSQNPDHILGLDVANLMGGVFVGRLKDPGAAAQALAMLGAPAGVGYEKVLLDLSPPHVRDRTREFVIRDTAGRVGRVGIDLTWKPDVMAALRSGAVGNIRSDDLLDEDAEGAA